MPPSLKKIVPPLLMLLALLGVLPAAGAEYRQVAGLIDLRSTFSDGAHDLDYLVKLAKERGFKVLFLTDHDRMSMEYGLPPFRKILKKRMEKPSVCLAGPEKYLEAIADVNRRYPDMLVIPGVESAPFYYWTGSPFFKEGLTAHNWERHILVIGLERPDDYKNLPILDNGLSTAYAKTRLPILLFFAAAALIGMFVLRWGGMYRFFGITLIVAGLALAVDLAPFSSSPYDQYHGDQGPGPYQLLLDYVKARGGLTFWNHPETRSGVGVKPPIRVDTPPYPELLEETTGYTGFAAVYGDQTATAEPGGRWDTLLLEYCAGRRKDPVWAISTADFHREGSGGERLGNFPTVFLIKKFGKNEILAALKTGRMYAARGPFDKRGVLAQFTVTDPATGNSGISGDMIALSGPASVGIKIKAMDDSVQSIRVRIIRGAELIKDVRGETPFSINFDDDFFQKGIKSYYRLDAQGGIGRIIANPVFVDFQ